MTTGRNLVGADSQMAPKTLEDYREAFRHAPIGRWRQASGTFGAVTDEIWEFRQNHTGRIIFLGPFGHPKHEQPFEWREGGSKQTILLRETDPDPGPAGHHESAHWVEISYDFKSIDTDVGKMIVMHKVPKMGAEFEGFFSTTVPLSYLGGIDEMIDPAGNFS